MKWNQNIFEVFSQRCKNVSGVLLDEDTANETVALAGRLNFLERRDDKPEDQQC